MAEPTNIVIEIEGGVLVDMKPLGDFLNNFGISPEDEESFDLWDKRHKWKEDEKLSVWLVDYDDPITFGIEEE